MSKIALLGDTHIGVKNGSPIFHKYFDKFYTEHFIPELLKRGIKTVYQFGDIHDNRKSVDSISIGESRRYLFDVLCQHGIQLHVLIGNHDIPYRNSLEYNSAKQLLSQYENIYLRDVPEMDVELRSSGISVDIIPWIAESNEVQIMDFINKSKSDYLFGHLELEGFSMQKGVKAHGGMSPTIFNKYKHVFSGHYHSHSTSGNITYLGVPYELTWADADDQKYFFIMDDKTGEVEKVPTPFTMFTKLYYDEDDMTGIDADTITDHYVRVYVVKRTDMKKYDKFITGLQSHNPYELKVVEDVIPVDSTVDDNVDIQDTLHLIQNYVENMDTDLDKERIQKMLKKLYMEAQSV